ncbi:MAG: hypothetical protein ACLQUZ_12450 [Rhizomicrobium sp.]
MRHGSDGFLRTALRNACLVAGFAWYFAGAVAMAAPPDAAGPPVTIYVQARQNLEGFRGDELPNFLAQTMSGAQAGPWRFAAAAPAGAPRPNRVEWSFVPGADAAGSVRTYGFSRAMMERLVGSNRVYSIEARLFLNGQYEALASGQFRETEDPQNPELIQEVTVIARTLMATPGVIDRASKPDTAARMPRSPQ